MSVRLKQWLQAALAWWSAGLLAALPARWVARLLTPPDTVTVARRTDKLVFKLYDRASGELLEERGMDAGDIAAQDGINRWLAQRPHDLRLTLLLPRDALLEKQLVYPLGAAPDLRALLAFEVERLTRLPVNKCILTTRSPAGMRAAANSTSLCTWRCGRPFSNNLTAWTSWR